MADKKDDKAKKPAKAGPGAEQAAKPAKADKAAQAGKGITEMLLGSEDL